MTAQKLNMPATPTPAGKTAAEIDERLDEELEQTFPASDPLPWTHDMVPTVRTMVPKRQSRSD